MAANVVPAEPRFSAQQSVFAVDPISGIPHRLSGDSSSSRWDSDEGVSYISVLVLVHGGTNEQKEERAVALAANAKRSSGLVWVWASASRSAKAEAGTMPNLALAVPPPRTGARANSSQLIGSNADDPTADIARRLSTRFKRPIYLSLSNVAASKMAAATSGGAMMSLASSIVAPADEVAALEKCLVAELKRALSAD